MIDWGKVSPGGSPTDTGSTPVAPAAPGGLPTLPPPPAPFEPYQTGAGYHEASQATVDSLDPGQRIARGIDFLGEQLFGRGNGSPLGGIPGLGDIVGGIGNIVHGVGTATIVKPVEAGATAISHIPLGWLPGGSDEAFNKIGQWAQTNDPQLYQHWQMVNTAANGDVLGGGNLKADFNMEAAQYLDDQKKESSLGTTPVLAMGREGVGSVGGALSHAIQGFLGIGANAAQRFLGEQGVFDPSGGTGLTFEQQLAAFNRTGQGMSEDATYAFQQLKSGAFSEQQARDYIAVNQCAGRNRVEEAAARLARGGEVSDVEKKAVEAWQSGAWSMAHAQDYIVSHGQGITRNIVGQVIGTALTDPLTYATLGAGSIAGIGEQGARIGAASFGESYNALSTTQKVAFAAQQEANYAKLATTVAAVRDDAVLGPIFRRARGLIDPFSVYKPSTIDRATTDMLSAVAVKSYGRAYGSSVGEVRAAAREAGITEQVDGAMASYAQSQARLMTAIHAQETLLGRGYGEEMLAGTVPVDQFVDTAVRNAPRDAETMLTDHLQDVMKNTFTAEEQAQLADRIAIPFGHDSAYWEQKIAGMSRDTKSNYHAVTYTLADKDLAEALAKIDREAYKGDLPLDQLALSSSENLNDVKAGFIIDNIRSVLKSKEPQKIAAGTAEWNAQARRYKQIADIGYAPGGEEQLKTLVGELEKIVKAGGVTRLALPEELNDAALKPLRDMLDRYTISGKGPLQPATLDPGGYAALPIDDPGYFYHVTDAGNLNEVRADGLVPHTPDFRGEQDLWPDGSEAARSYFSGSSKGTEPFSEGNPAILRVKNTGGFKPEKGTPDFVTERTIPPEEVEYLKSDGTWVPITAEEPGGAPLWNVGFRPDETVAWGLKRDPHTGEPIIDRAPTISHVTDAVPGRQPFSDTTRNVLGQIVGKSKAERINGPVDSMEQFLNTLRDSVTGHRLVKNIEQRYERITFDSGIPKPLAQDIFKVARDVAALDRTTIRGIAPDNLWQRIADMIPRDLVLTSGKYAGQHLNQHIVMDQLLQASEGDLRIMGLTNVLTQRMRNRLRTAGLDPANMSGQMTVTMYNRLRYSLNPTFLIQRITDAPYYSILYGVTPVGKRIVEGANAEVRAIEENLGRTGMARDFSMDVPELATRSNFTEGIKSAMQQAGLNDNKLERILRAPDDIIAANMTNMLHARLGDMVKGSLDNLTAIAEKDPEVAAEMLQAGEAMTNTWADWVRQYSEQAGRVLNDQEVGLRYFQDQMNSWRRHVVLDDGTLNFEHLIAEGERSLPNEIGEIGTIRPDMLAERMGYADEQALRKDVMGQIAKINPGEYMLIHGESGVTAFEENLREVFGAHPDYVRRAVAYFSDDWKGFWERMARPIDQNGLDISPHYAQEAQALISIWARQRGMTPWEFLSGVMASNIGAKDLDTAMGQLFAFLKSGKTQAPLEEWTKVFRSTLDVSAQKELLREFESAVPIEDVLHVPTPGAAMKDAKGNAKLPSGYNTTPGYVYRIEKLDAARGGWQPKTGVSTEANPMYFRGDPGEGVFRTRDLGNLATGRHGAGGKDRLTTTYITPQEIEMLNAKGEWEALGPDPMDTIMSKDFPEAVRQRLMSGTPHQNPEVEAYIEQFSKWVQESLAPELGTETRRHLRELVQRAGGIKPQTPEEAAAAAVTDADRAAYAAGYASAQKSKVADLNAASARYSAKNPDYSGPFFEHGWADQAAGNARGAAIKTAQDTASERASRVLGDMSIPTQFASPFNRSQALIISLLKAKFNDAQADVFRLAEMQTKRSVLERSINHPLFGLYPASYMWGKVLPETVKFLAKNPYAATYVIADVQRAIAIQREYDPDMDQKMNAIDHSSAAFLLDYLTPGLPWSDHQARMSPLFRGIMNGKDLGQLWDEELATVSPQRWVAQVVNTLNEVPGAIDTLTQPPEQAPAWQQGLQQLEGAPAPGAAPATPQQITGPTRASALGPILEDDLTRLQSILLAGESPEK